MTNFLFVIEPYSAFGTWVFDDFGRDLVAEPFVCGIPEIIDRLVEEARIENAEDGFTLLFSAVSFPGACRMEWVESESGGNWYRQVNTKQKGWLCPALLKYFPKAPPNLYVKAEALRPKR